LLVVSGLAAEKAEHTSLFCQSINDYGIKFYNFRLKVFDLGQNGQGLIKVASITQQSIVKEAAKVAL
jgi:hypothetical protein